MKPLQIVTAGLVAAGLLAGSAGTASAQMGGPGGETGYPMARAQRGGTECAGQCGGMQRGGVQRGGMRGGGMHGGGMRGGGMHGRMRGGMGGNIADMRQIHTLLAGHGSIQRTVRKLPDGVETVTTSRDARIAAMLPEHVNAMYARMKEGRMICGFDPLFVELFRQADRIAVKVEPLKDGVRVVETSRDPYAVKLIQAHADAVDGFVKDGMAAMHRTHPVPPRPAAERK
jgi:uncharacterized protein